MRLFGNWHLGWARQIAIGVIWTDRGAVGILFLGLTLSRNLRLKPSP